MMWSYLQLGVMGTCTAFAPNYASYCVFRFAGGMALSGFGLSIACLGEETGMRTTTGSWVGIIGMAVDGDNPVAVDGDVPMAMGGDITVAMDGDVTVAQERDIAMDPHVSSDHGWGQ